MYGIRTLVSGIMPEYMFDALIEKGSKRLKHQALNALKCANYLRTQRSLQNQQQVQSGYNYLIAKHYDLYREVYDAENTEGRGLLMRREGEPPTGDLAADEAYLAAGATWQFYHDIFGRDSIDDRGMPLIQTVHFGEDYENAFWDGEQMVFGDGDGEIFERFTIDVEVTGHELTHGVIEHEANFHYFGQSGALHESFADVFGSLVKQYLLQQRVEEADWLIGQCTVIGDEYALRSMKAPGTAYIDHPILGTDPQPSTMDSYYHFPPWKDNGGVHYNSSIPNHAFYLSAMALGGYAWEQAGLIWYRALCDKLSATANFRQLADVTIMIAREEYGANSQPHRAIRNAWKEVKVL